MNDENDELREMFKSKNIKEEQKTQLTAALAIYIKTMQVTFEKKLFPKMFMASLGYMAVGMKLIFRTLRGDYRK